MAKIEGTFICGHEGVIRVDGPHDRRPYIIELKFSKLCPNCKEKQKEDKQEQEYQEALSFEAAESLSKLSGSVNQVRWATVLRYKYLIAVEEYVDAFAQKNAAGASTPESKKKVADFIDKLYCYANVHNCATRWIENRFIGPERAIEEVFKFVPESDSVTADEDPKAVIDEATVYPEGCESKNICRISIKEGHVVLASDKDDRIIEIAHLMKMRWESGCGWRLDIFEYTGLAEDRAAELGNRLLRSGLPVCIIDNKVREMAVSGAYEPRCNRWIGTADTVFCILFERDDKLYNAATSLPRARWCDRCVQVKIQYFKEIEDFAELFDFRLTKNAQAALKLEREKYENARRVLPVEVEEAPLKDGLAEILKSPADILEDLKDN